MSNPKPADSRDIIEEVDDNSWIIGHVIITRHESEPSQPCWEDGKGAFFSIGEVPTPKPPTRPASDACSITDAIGSSPGWGLWRIGLAHLRISGQNFGTLEHVTLEALAKRSLDFQVPEVYYHGEFEESYYVVYSVLPGKSIADVWPTTNQAVRTRWAQQIAEAYHELSKWRGDRICGVDGRNWVCHWLCKDRTAVASSYEPEVLRQNFEEIGLDCSELVFAHCQMMPLSFMVDENQGLVGITFWETAGFVPKDWIRTMSRSNCFTEAIHVIKWRSWSLQDEDDWVEKIEAALKEKGFNELWEKNCIWRNKLHERWFAEGRSVERRKDA
ncbi:uncharacterized protein FTOL_10948 [Fusarium torulosum]|uniref:Aminoglycoside phosphotransferase domain-containing protein n=1 Tax=Fusarium torulosum TaxID=33205 RepID=A0AAE8SMI0_9HYPO|nr:uncharacterized protein FTOL_10948 [Fusarium torulosum]